LENHELDRLIAEKVMEWEVASFPNIQVVEAYTEFGTLQISDDFSPSTDIQDAWLVVKKMNQKFAVEVRTTLNDGAECFLYRYQEETESYIPVCSAEEKDAMMAICLAALKVVSLDGKC
jgi:hypothetical protein